MNVIQWRIISHCSFKCQFIVRWSDGHAQIHQNKKVPYTRLLIVSFLQGQGSIVYAPSQWETTLDCNVVSHRLAAYTKWSCRDSIFATPVHITWYWYSLCQSDCIGRKASSSIIFVLWELWVMQLVFLLIMLSLIRLHHFSTCILWIRWHFLIEALKWCPFNDFGCMVVALVAAMSWPQTVTNRL